MMWFLQRKIRRRLVKVVAIVVLSLALTLPLNAVTLSSWVGEEWPEIEAIGEGDQLPMTCNASSMTVSRLDKDKNEYFEAVQVCATITKFGTIGIEHNGATVTGKTYLQMGGPAYELGFNGRVLPVPNADYLVTRYRPGGGVAWSRATSFIENPATLEVDSRTNTYKASAATVSQTLNDPVTGQRIVSYPGAAVSSDGRWLLIERSTGLLRVDLENRDQMGSFGYGGSYGAGNNPVLHLAISNDGNHVFQSGSANYSQAYVTDLTTCTLDYDTPLIRNTNCVRKSLWQYLRSELGNISSIYYPYFNDDASTLAVSILISGEVFKDVMLFQPGYQHGLLDYLALGDSFSSGEGDRDGGTWYVEGTDGTAEFPNEKCHLSTRSYPLLIATKTSLSNELAKSVACSGATTEDVRGGHKDGKPYRGQFDQFEDKTEEDEDHVSAIQEALAGFLPGRAAQIEFVREYKPKVITLTIGGNDVGFAHKLKACIGLSTHLASQTCDYATERTGTGLEIWRQFENLKQLYLDLQNASPKTSIYVLGYPKFFGEEVCGLNVGLDAHERDYINRSVSYMNDVIEAAAKSAGVTYVDVSDSLAGYNLCSGTSDHAFNGITYGKDQGVAGLDFISNGSYHPNEKGHELMTTSILSQFPDINHRQKCEGNSIICFDSSVFPPPIPDYFITSDSDVMPYSKS